MDQYAEEAKNRWGHTQAYKQSVERAGKLSKDEFEELKRSGIEFVERISSAIDLGPGSHEVQKLIGQHYESIRTFYDPNIELYRGLAEMYVDDARFAAYWNRFRPDMAAKMRVAMLIFCDGQ